MTRRILGGFLAVLLAMIILVVVPLGARLASRERHDFARVTTSEARSLAAVAEERLSDAVDTTDRGTPIRLDADRGERVAILDVRGRVIASAGAPIATATLDAARSGRRPAVEGAVVATAAVGESTRRIGTVVVVRDTGPVDHQVLVLWLGLVIAALVALAVGALVALGLARWITRPLRALHVVTERMGHGDLDVRVASDTGPPEVRDVAAAFNDMAGRIATLLASQRVMTQDVSHQLRTPLSALQLRLELLADDAPADLQPEIGGALREIGRLRRLADGLLAVARAEEVAAAPSRIDVGAVIDERVDLWSTVAQERGVVLRASADAAGAALATPGHLEQVLDNLIANAVDAVASGDHVTVSARWADDDVVVTVADDGPGLSAQRRAEAFTRFSGQRADTGGSGLGLAIVARLVAADHGTTTLDETEGGGLTVVVRLPAATSTPVTVPGH